MQILPERGLYGAIAYIYMYWVTFVRFKKYIPAKIVLFFLLGLGVMETATGVLNMAVWGVVLLAMKRLYQIGEFRVKQNKKQQNDENNRNTYISCGI